ncbi:MAG: peptidylprolyl isomerase [Nanoarchaeota archaeon]|nr:peptidylprolyl isomerase [Nanoarchaeota archaeon]
MKNPIVVFETSKGNFEVELNPEKAPISTANFLNYTKEGHYNGLIFHRVIDGFMVQGGGFTPNMEEKDVKAPIKNEAGNGLRNDKYTIAMARTGIVDSATSQFYVNVADNAFLNHQDNSARGFGYAVFGKVVNGFETIDAMKGVETHSVDGSDDVPVEPIVIKKAYLKP